MVTKDVKRLLKKLNEYTTRSLEAAAGFCRGFITLIHFEKGLRLGIADRTGIGRF